MTELDELAIKQVAIDGHHMKLKGDDRLEAIRWMAARGLFPQEMAMRLCIKTEYLQKIAREAKITLPKAITPVHWSYNYIFVRGEQRERKHREDATRRKRKQRERKRQQSGGSSDMEGTPVR